ncbi:Hook domain-containing protein, partial [Globisporangium splendens]
MDDAAQRSLLLWVQSFHETIASDIRVDSMVDLCDGVFLAKIMHQIDPEYLNMELINEQPAGNWALKTSNLKTLLRAIELYYNEELGQLCEANELIDAHLIAKENDIREVAKLAELILGCAVQCPNRSEYIHLIMEMEASEQASMMHMIENIMHRFQVTSPSGGRNSLANSSFSYISHEGETSESLAIQLTHALEKVSSMELKMLDMENEKRELTERFENSLSEKQSLADKYAALEDERDKLLGERQSTLTRDNKKIQQIVEGEIHALTLQLEEKNEELQRVKRESTERLMVLENEVRRQADELDISRSKLGQLAKLESSVSKYKKKLEEMNSLRNQVTDLEMHNAQYLDKVLDLESTVKTMPTLKALVERYKNQVVDLETANVEAVSNNQVKDQKIRRLQEELDSALGGKEFLESQVEELRSQLTSMQHHGAIDTDGSMPTSGGEGGFSADVLLGRDGGSSLRERVARLERENAQLKSGNENAEAAYLSNELDMALKAKESLQVSVGELKKQNEELSEQLRVAQQQHQQQLQQQAAQSGSAAADGRQYAAIAAGSQAVEAASATSSATSTATSSSSTPTSRADVSSVSPVEHTAAAGAPGASAVPGVTGVPGAVGTPATGVAGGAPSQLMAAPGVAGSLSSAAVAETVVSGITAVQVAAYEEKIQKLVRTLPVPAQQLDLHKKHKILAVALASLAVLHQSIEGWEELLDRFQVSIFSLLAFLMGVLVRTRTANDAIAT